MYATTKRFNTYINTQPFRERYGYNQQYKTITLNNGVKIRVPVVSDLARWISDKFRRNNEVVEPDKVAIEYTPLVSTNLESAAYNPENKIMRVIFNTGGIYQYYDVPLGVYNGLVNAPSVGRYFFENVRDVYNYEQISG